MTLDYYRIFYYVARYKSFSNAAEMLGSNQPNITRCMNILENELDCKLLIRSHKGIQLTTEGEHLFRHVAIAIEQLTYGEKEIIKNKSLESGQITVGISETAMRLYLLDKIQEFHKDYPHVRLKISNHSTPQAIDALEKGLVDIAMVTSPLEIRKPLRKTALRSYHDILIGGSAYKAIASRKRSLKELEDYSFVSLISGTGTSDLYIRFFYENHMRFSPDMEVATTDQILPMVRSNLGIGFCPEGIARPAVERGEVYEILLEEEIPELHIVWNERLAERQITLVEDSGKPQSIAVQKLLTYFK